MTVECHYAEVKHLAVPCRLVLPMNSEKIKPVVFSRPGMNQAQYLPKSNEVRYGNLQAARQ